jgi:hypothetical protein
MKIVLLAFVACFAFSCNVQEAQAQAWSSVSKICSKRFKTYSPEWNECCIQEVERQVAKKKSKGLYDEYSGFDENDGVDRCDAGVRPGRYPGNSMYEVDEKCYAQCYQACDYRRNHNTFWMGNCRNSCEEKCNRCNKYVYDQLYHKPGCPVPKCLLKDQAWQKCLKDPQVGNQIQYFDRALRVLRSKGVYDHTWKLPRNIKYFYCRCKTQDSTEEGCNYFPPPMKSRRLRSIGWYY